ncbi:hypothetical protein ACM66B_004708 [Microbotryomycetes sp. NB124-2]
MSTSTTTGGADTPASSSILSKLQIDPALVDNVEFLQGLDAIIGPMIAQGASQQDVQGIVERAQSFFLAQQQQQEQLSTLDVKVNQTPVQASSSNVDVQEQPDGAPLQASTLSNSASSTATPAAPSPSKDDAPYPVSFQQLAALIASGAPIPGIKDIPDKLAEGSPSQSQIDVQKVRKPWEQRQSQESNAVAMGSSREMTDQNAQEGSGQV